MANRCRDGDGGNGEADGLPLTAARAADGVAHEQKLWDVPHTKPRAAKALTDAELALQRNAAGHLFELRLANGVGGPKGARDVLLLLTRHGHLQGLVAGRLERRRRPGSQRGFHLPCEKSQVVSLRSSVVAEWRAAR